MSDKITADELASMFGRPWVPVRAMLLIEQWTGTADDLRVELRQIAAQEARRQFHVVRGADIALDDTAHDTAQYNDTGP